MGKLAPTEDAQLTEWEGKQVVAAGIEIPGAAGGLQDAMAIDPAEFESGETVYVVLACVVRKVAFEPIKKGDYTGDQRRVHTFDTEGAVIVDKDLVAEAVNAQTAKIQAAREAEEGRLNFGIKADPEEGDQAKRIRTWLAGLDRTQVRALCDKHEIEYKERTSTSDLVEALIAHAPEIEEKLSAEVLDDAEARSDDNVTPIGSAPSAADPAGDEASEPSYDEGGTVDADGFYDPDPE